MFISNSKTRIKNGSFLASNTALINKVVKKNKTFLINLYKQKQKLHPLFNIFSSF